MSGKIIATIYFYVISAFALALIVIGIFNAVNFGVNSTMYDKYPLRYQAGSCENYPEKYGGVTPARLSWEPTLATPSAVELEKQKQLCLAQEEKERIEHRIDDLKNAVTFSLVGLLLFVIHFPQAKKFSKS